MSSAVRSHAVKKEALTRFVKPESPSYTINPDIDPDVDTYIRLLFPFSYSNQTLDITYSGNTFKALMVDDLGNEPRSESSTIVSILGGPYLVTSLGENFKAYVRSWRSSTIDSGSPIEVYVPAQILRVQEASRGNVNAIDGDSWLITTSAPASDNYIAGTEQNNYQTTYIFKTPLTFSIVEGGVKKYITFRTALDQE
jgi:hypothetical protein